MNTVPSPPADANAEGAVVGCILRDPSLLENVRLFVEPAHLVSEEASAVFAAACALADAHKPVTAITIIGELERTKALPNADAGRTVLAFAEAVMTTAHAEYYAATVKEKAIARSVISFTGEIQRQAFDGQQNAAELLDALQTGAARIAEGGFIDAGKLAGDGLAAVLDDIHGFRAPEDAALSTGFPELDQRTGGLKRKHLICIGGAGKIGKTSFALNIVAHVGLALRQPVALISHEMTFDELVERLLISTTGVSRARLVDNRLTAGERDHYQQVQQAIKDSRIVIDDQCGPTVHATRQRLRLFQRLYKIKLAVIDYFQLMGGDPRTRRYDQLVDVSRGLKQIASDLDLPIIVLAQLNAEGQDSTRPPRVTDIEECKRIFKDSNVVILLDREYERRRWDRAYMASATVDPRAATIDVAAIRAGEAGVIRAEYRGDIQRWSTESQAADARLDMNYGQIEIAVLR